MNVVEYFSHRLTFTLFLRTAALTSIALLAIRVVYTGGMTYVFLLWNLLLAWIPYGIAFVLEKVEGQKAQPLSVVFPLYVVWLLFFPNAPYILTDFIHLDALALHAVPLWYDALLIASFGATGLGLGLKSLHMIHHSLRMRFGHLVSWAIVLAVMLLSGFGVYLGRFPRWNSWDILSNPWYFASDTAERLTSPTEHPYLILVTFSFALILFVSYAAYLWLLRMKQRQNNR